MVGSEGCGSVLEGRGRRLGSVLVAMLAGALVAALLGPAVAAPILGGDPLPRVAFVARNDVPFDSLAVGPVAGALGGIVVITGSGSLSSSARDALVAFDPDLVYIAGGTAAVSGATEEQIKAAGGWEVRRVAGAGRDQTAALLAQVLGDLGVGRPLVTGAGQVLGDATLGGTLTVDRLAVADPTVVANLNAERLGGFSADDFARRPANVVVVAADGGDHTSVQAAIDSITDASASNRYVVLIAPGVHHGRVVMKPFVDVRGSGPEATIIRSVTSSAEANPYVATSSATVVTASDTRLSDVRVVNAGQTDGQDSAGVVASGVQRVVLDNVTAEASGTGGRYHFGVLLNSASGIVIERSRILGTGAGASNSGLFAYVSSLVTARDSRIEAVGGTLVYGVYAITAAVVTLEQVTVLARDGSSVRALNLNGGDVHLRHSSASATGGTTENVGLRAFTSVPRTSTVEHSVLVGSTNTVTTEDQATVRIAQTRLQGGPVEVLGGTLVCFSVYDGDFNAASCAP
jgi:hypothetical protein